MAGRRQKDSNRLARVKDTLSTGAQSAIGAKPQLATRTCPTSLSGSQQKGNNPFRCTFFTAREVKVVTLTDQAQGRRMTL